MSQKSIENGDHYSLFKHQVSGKAPKLVTADKKIILKCYIQQQHKFYSYYSTLTTTHPHYQLKKYIPNYIGSINLASRPIIEYVKDQQNKQISIWLEHVKMRYDKKNQGNKFILLSNFLSQFIAPNVLDIKIGGRQEKPKKITKLVQQYKMKLNGMFKTTCTSTSEFISKYHLNQITDFSQTTKYLAYFFNINGKLQIQALNAIAEELQELAMALRAARGWKFVSTSICLVYDSRETRKTRVQYIDFARSKLHELDESYDVDTSSGIEYVIKMIKEIKSEPEKYENITIDKKENEDVVPLSKVKKFEVGSDRELNDHQIIENGR